MINEIMKKIIYGLKIIRTILFLRWNFKRIGRMVVFGRHNTISGKKYIEIGSHCFFGNNMRLQAISKYGGRNYNPNILIEDEVVINQNFHCTCAQSVFIGRGTSITANCGVFDIIHPYERIDENPRKNPINTSPVKICANCLICMNTVILPGANIGNHCIIGANSTVIGTIPDYSVAAGSPAKVVKSYNFDKKIWEKKMC